MMIAWNQFFKDCVTTDLKIRRSMFLRPAASIYRLLERTPDNGSFVLNIIAVGDCYQMMIAWNQFFKDCVTTDLKIRRSMFLRPAASIYRLLERTPDNGSFVLNIIAVGDCYQMMITWNQFFKDCVTTDLDRKSTRL